MFLKAYRNMEQTLQQAVGELNQARPLVPERCRETFQAEDLSIRWLYAVARTQANFHESCQLRDALLALAARKARSAADTARAARMYGRWRQVLMDERANAQAALPVMLADVRIDFYYNPGSSLPHGADMIRAKIALIGDELNTFLPSVARKCGISPTG